MPKHNMPHCDEGSSPAGWRAPDIDPPFVGYQTHNGTSFEVFHVDEEHVQHSAAPTEPGWYWWPCQPGCLPDTDDGPDGPYATAEGAYLAAIGD